MYFLPIFVQKSHDVHFIRSSDLDSASERVAPRKPRESPPSWSRRTSAAAARRAAPGAAERRAGASRNARTRRLT